MVKGSDCKGATTTLTVWGGLKEGPRGNNSRGLGAQKRQRKNKIGFGNQGKIPRQNAGNLYVELEKIYQRYPSTEGRVEK